jgi:FixJ family two-component response regulator
VVLRFQEERLNSNAPGLEGGVPRALVLIVDDDEPLREALSALFRSVGLEPRAFGSVAALMEFKPPDVDCCLVLDVRLPGVSGLDFHGQLASRYRDMPVIFMTGHGDIPMSVRAMKAGAVDFLAKPFRDQDMLDAVASALAKDSDDRTAAQAASALRSRFESLTKREREIMGHVAAGLANKQIAAQVGISEITVKVHRGAVMRKMGARSVVDLVRMTEMLKASSVRPAV